MIGILGVQAMSEVEGRISPKNNMLLLASRKDHTQIHWHVLSLIYLPSLEAQHYLSFPEEEKEVQRWKRMHRSQSQRKDSVFQLNLRWANTLQASKANSWVCHLTEDEAETRNPTFSCWVKPTGTSDQGHQVFRKRTWTPSSFRSRWEQWFSAVKPCRDVTSREKQKIHLLSSLVTPSVPPSTIYPFKSFGPRASSAAHASTENQGTLHLGVLEQSALDWEQNTLKPDYWKWKKLPVTQPQGIDWIGNKIKYFKTFLLWLSADILPPTKRWFAEK